MVDPRVGDDGPALLALEDGTVFPGVAFGAPVAAGGDLVVNTSQTGYQEICTDPSYAGQVVVMTYPLIGNYGRLADDDQSARPWLRGLSSPMRRRRCSTTRASSRRCCATTGIPAIAGVDTRALARHLRETGCLRGIITEPGVTDRDDAVDAARAVARWEDQDFVAQVSPAAVARGRATATAAARRDRRLRPEGEHRPLAAPARGPGPGAAAHGAGGRRCWRRTCGRRPVAGPGRPGAARGTGRARARRHRRRPAAARHLPRPPDRRLGRRAPRPGGCGSATTAPTTRSRTWTPGYVQVTAQNHEVQVVGDSLPGGVGFRVSQLNLNDRSVEGLRHAEQPIETVQYHPEGAPGPLDALAVFDRFVDALPARRVTESAGVDRVPEPPGGPPPQARVRADPRLRAGRHRPGGGVRLRGDPGLPRAPRGGRPHDPRQLATRPRS